MIKLAVVLGVLAMSSAAWAQVPMTAGEVTKVDRPLGRITLKHGEIKNLEMPAMTMVFQVRQAQLLDGINVGDRVRFAAEKLEGRYTVTVLAKVP